MKALVPAGPGAGPGLGLLKRLWPVRPGPVTTGQKPDACL